MNYGNGGLCMNRSNKSSDGSYLFQVEINVSASNKGAALKHLLRVLNNAEFVNYRIGSGIKLSETKENTDPETPKSETPKTEVPPKKAAKSQSQPNPLELRIRQYIESNKLIRLNINKGRGVKMSIPCRIINFDPGNQLLTVYHVDEKQVYSVKINEIDDFVD
jgi:hypothetical protein